MIEATNVSVVTPAFNAAHTIGAAIGSALRQTNLPDEILVVDDGSTDATAKIVAAYPAPVVLIRREHGGPAAARNSALAQARGRFVALLDADDQFLPEHLERCAQTWHRRVAEVGSERVIVTGNAYRLTRAGLTTSTILPKDFPRPEEQRAQILQANFTGIFAFYPRQLHDEIGYFDPKLNRGEDLHLWARAIYSGWQVVAQPTPHAIYRMGAGSLTSDSERMASAERTVLEMIRDQFGRSMTAAEREYVHLRLDMPAPRELVREANEFIRVSSWVEAEHRLRAAAELVPFDRRLKARARLARHRLGRPVLSWLLRASDKKLGRRTFQPPTTANQSRLADTSLWGSQ